MTTTVKTTTISISQGQLNELLDIVSFLLVSLAGFQWANGVAPTAWPVVVSIAGAIAAQIVSYVKTHPA